MKKHLKLCIDAMLRTQDEKLVMDKWYMGPWRLTEDGERVECEEEMKKSYQRNPTIWSGRHVNVHRNKDGQCVLHMKKTELTSRLDPGEFADEVFLDVERAKKDLGL